MDVESLVNSQGEILNDIGPLVSTWPSTRSTNVSEPSSDKEEMRDVFVN